jgi:anaerobic selenocysteine-containing dehydrogenase
MDNAIRTPAFCTQCRSRCGCVAVVDDGRLTGIEPLPSHPTGDKLCPKGRAAPELVYHPDRLTRPLRRTNPKGAADPGWQPISWEAALDEIANRMLAIKAEHAPEQVAFSVTTPSGSHLSDAIAWIERMVRAYGSPNTIYATEICNWHKDFASRFTYGSDIGTPDFAHTDCVLLWGNNPAVTWLARATEVQRALKRGARMIVVDPRPTAFAKRADQWLQARPGTDQALALGLANLLIEAGAFERAFVETWTNGLLLVRSDTGRFLRQSDLDPAGRSDILYAATADGSLVAYDAARGAWLESDRKPLLRARAEVQGVQGPLACRTAFDIYAAAAAEFPPDRVASVTGVPEADLHNAAAILGSSASVAYYAWNGIGQSVTATQTDRALSLLYALTGSYGRSGGNVPGGAAPFADISGQDLLTSAQRAKALGHPERPLGPPNLGYVTARDVYRAVLTGKPYPVRMLVSFGTNLVVSQPDLDLARRAFEALDFHVHADFFLNATARYADIVLPAATSWEREGLRAGFDGSLAGLRCVQLRPAVIAPVGEARSDIDIVLSLASRLGLADVMFGCDADRGHDAVLAPVSGRDRGRDLGDTRGPRPTKRQRRRARLSHAHTPHRGLLRAPAGARLHACPVAPCGRRSGRHSEIPAAARLGEDRRLLPQPAPQHRLLTPPDARSAPRNTALRRGRARYRRRRLGLHHHRAWPGRRPRQAGTGPCRRHRLWPARLVGRRAARQPLRRAPPLGRQHQPRDRHVRGRSRQRLHSAQVLLVRGRPPRPGGPARCRQIAPLARAAAEQRITSSGATYRS